MIVSLPKTVRRMYFLLMFVLLSYLLYHFMSFIGEWINPIQQQDIPEGTAVRAFHDAYYGSDGMKAGERLRYYYWYGE
ncbi:hypothetical protein A8L34_04840 [Bacillus sp. FJAT-27264]|uniref:DUF4227 family protein n=1 Tax=Paenibacillus sp. (strain DSM 101736 / FJAT-27264) TaxID=1850362 RepID=UPI000807B768|nr:DUF4227 family protein [Bacillus sp. FJAT-27264]OBZ18881.1 hypothetical protein A8L34_04840 [Bacillus sp. FJAT-27264]